MFKRILVAVDFSDNSAFVVEQAAKLAKPLEAQLTLLHVQVLPVGALEYDGGTAEERAKLADSPGGELYTLKQLAEIPHSIGVTTSYRSMNGNPTEVIMAVAEETAADLIVLGSHGHGKLYHLLAGSVRESMIANSQVPVLVFRKPVQAATSQRSDTNQTAAKA